MKPVRVITGNPGATADILARHIAAQLNERWGRPVIVDNRGGAAGTISAEIAAHALPDGYTLLMGQLNSHALAVSLHRKLSYDPLTDFAPITRVALAPLLFVVNSSMPTNSWRELADYARQRPGQIDYASAGNGTTSHLTAELFKQAAGLDLLHIPYKGGGAAIRAVMSAEVKTGFVALASAWPILKSGKIRALAIASRQRFPTLPDVPTLDEGGLPKFESTTWFGMFAPAHTGKALVARLNRDIVEILRTPSVRQDLLKQGAEPAPGTPEEFTAFIKSEIVKWRDVIKTAGIQPQ